MNSEAVGPTTVSQDLLAAALGALMTLGAGLLVLIGYFWLSAFGAVLGAAGAIAWGVWWRNKHGQFFPKALQGAFVVRIALLVGALTVVFFVSL
jgi:hypothetical protein